MNKKYGKLVIVSSKFTAKYGGYCQKLENKMVDIDGYLADILERIYGKIWWILPKVGKKYGGIIPKNI